jgi:hypothetical protein
VGFEAFRYNNEPVYEEGTMECKRDCYSSKESLLFKKGEVYKTQISGDTVRVYDELNCLRPLIIANKPTELMKDFFKPNEK